MTTFDERERAFEAKFAHDQEMLFRVQARRDRLLAAWAAERLGLTQAEAESYARDLVHTDFELTGNGHVVKKLLGDLTSAGVEIDEAEIQAQIEMKSVEARRQLITSLDL